MASVTVLYFAALREDRGLSEEVLDVPDGTSLAALYQTIFAASPLLAMPVAYACNHDYASGDVALKDGDEICFLPPLGGG